MSFIQDVVVATCGTIISFKSIESFKFTDASSEEAVISKLKDDVFFEFRTVSGKEYTSSALTLCTLQFQYSKEFIKTVDLYQKEKIVRDVYSRWLWLLKPQEER